MNQTKTLRAHHLVVFALSVACNSGPQGEPGPRGEQGPKGDRGSSVAVTAEPQGLNCSGGGVRIDAAGESHYACNGSPDPASALIPKLTQVDGEGSGLDADLLDGLDSSALQRRVEGSCATGISSVQTDGGVSCAAPVFKRVLVVSGSGTPSENAAALRSAVAQAASISLTAAPTVVLLEPGTYDLGNTPLNISGGARVHLHGLGREVVNIRATNTNGTIRVFASTLWMEHLTLQTASVGVGSALSLWLTVDAVATLRDVSVLSTGTPWAIHLSDSSTPGGATPSLLLENSEVDARFYTGTGDAIRVVDGSVVIRHSTIVTSGVSPRALNVTGGNGQNRITHTQVVGGVSGSVTCFGAYGASYTALSSTCQ